MAFQFSKTNLLYIAGRAQRKIEENTDKKILTVYDTDFLYTTTDLSRELVNKIDASYGIVRIETQVSLCDEFYSVRTEDIECQPECVYCNCTQGSTSSISTTCGLEAPYEITCSCFDNTINGCEHVMTLNLTQSCCDGGGATQRTGKPCFKTFNSNRSGSKTITSPPIWHVPFDNDTQQTVGEYKRPTMVSGDNHVVSFARKYENLNALLDPTTPEPYPELVAWGDNSLNQINSVPKLCNPPPTCSSSSGEFCRCTEADSDIQFGQFAGGEPKVAISAVGDSTFLAHQKKSEPSKLVVKSFGKTQFNHEFNFNGNPDNNIRISPTESISGIKEGSIKGIKSNGRDTTMMISSDGRFLMSLNDGAAFSSLQDTIYAGKPIKYDQTQVKFGTTQGSVLKITSGINTQTFSELVGTTKDNLVLSQSPKILKSSNTKQINGQTIYDIDYNMNFGSIQEPLPLGGSAINNLTDFRNKVVDSSGSWNKSKQVYEMQISKNNTITAMTTKGDYPTWPSDNNPRVLANNSNVLDLNFQSILGSASGNSIPGSSFSKIDNNTSFKMSDSGHFCVLVTNEGKAIVSTLKGLPASASYNFNIPSDMVFDPRYITVTDDSITLVESNCTYIESEYLTRALVYSYADIKAAAASSSVTLNDKTDIEDQLRTSSQYILIIKHIFGPTQNVKFKIGTKKTAGNFEWLEKILKVTDAKKHIKIYLTAAEATQLLNKISVYAYAGEVTNPTAYNIFTSKIDCTTSTSSTTSSSSSSPCRRIDGSISSSTSSSTSSGGTDSTSSSLSSTSSPSFSSSSDSFSSSSSSSAGTGPPLGLMYVFGAASGKCITGDFTFNNTCLKCTTWGITDPVECYSAFMAYIETNPKASILSEWGECNTCNTICNTYENVNTIARSCCKNTEENNCGTDRVCISKNYCNWINEGFVDSDCPQNYKLISENYSILSGNESSNYYVNCCHSSDPNEPFGVCGETCGSAGCNQS